MTDSTDLTPGAKVTPAEGTVFTPNLNLAKQPTGAQNWGQVLNDNFDKIDEAANQGGGLEIGDIGFAPLGIDETQNKRRYLNGQVISQTQFATFADKVKAAIALYPSLSATETNWQAEVVNSKLGQCGKFVIDDTAGTIRLPKVVNINGLQNLANLGSIKAESLPNITGSLIASNRGAVVHSSTIASGVFTVEPTENSRVAYSGSGGNANLYFDASNSSSTYQDNAPVQQEAIQYPYFIQVATGSEESVDVSTEIQLNNPFSLLDYKWSEYELSNASWLISNGSFHSGTTYSAVYELLLKIYNGTETKDGVSVKLSTEAYTDFDFVLNTVDTTFRLPVKVKLASGNAVAGNGMTLGVTNGTSNAGLVHASSSGNWFVAYTGGYGDNVSATADTSGTSIKGQLGITTDPTKSGIETSSQGLYLYFYVGETVQDANVIAATGVLTRIANLSDSYISGLGMPSNNYIDIDYTVNTLAEYTAPANGYYAARVGNTAAGTVEVRNDTAPGVGVRIEAAGKNQMAFCPCQKGDTVAINVGGSLAFVRFIYAEGEI